MDLNVFEIIWLLASLIKVEFGEITNFSRQAKQPGKLNIDNIVLSHKIQQCVFSILH